MCTCTSTKKVWTVLGIGCGLGGFGAHFSHELMPVCMASYESTGSQVQVALERGLPAIISNFISKQLPFPSLSYDMVHCAQCCIIWDDKDGILLIEIDQVLKPGGYFVLTSPRSHKERSSLGSKQGSMSTPFEEFAQKICWKFLAQQEDTFIWPKTADAQCHISS